MRFSILTPTVLRKSLQRLCDSIDGQDFEDYEHLIFVDRNRKELTREQKLFITKLSANPRRHFLYTDRAFNDIGNTPRKVLSIFAKGDYCTNIDDDDMYIDSKAFSKLTEITYFSTAQVIVFPAHRFGHRFFNPGKGGFHTTSCQYIWKRIIDFKPIRWQFTNNNYTADAEFIDYLINNFKVEWREELGELVGVDMANGGRIINDDCV